jgi:hypothetical protein
VAIETAPTFLRWTSCSRSFRAYPTRRWCRISSALSACCGPNNPVSCCSPSAPPMFGLVPISIVLLRHFDTRAVVVLGFSAFAAANLGGTQLTHDWARSDFIGIVMLQSIGQALTLFQARPAWAVHAGAVRLCESINALVRRIRLVTSFPPVAARSVISDGAGRRSLHHTLQSALRTAASDRPGRAPGTLRSSQRGRAGTVGRFRPRKAQLDGAFRAQRRHQDCNSVRSR